MELKADSVIIINGNEYAGDYIIKLLKRREKELEQWRNKSKRQYQKKIEVLHIDNSALIYKLYTDNNEDCYIGTTSTSFELRLKQHFSKTNNCSSKVLIDKYGKENIKYMILEKCNTNNQYERENFWINCINNCINKRKQQ
jgi:hypothetical protein